MKRHTVSSEVVDALCGKPVNLYSHGVAVQGGRTVYIAGQYAPGEGDAAAQYRSCLQKIQAIVQAEGGTLADLVKVVNYVSSAVDLDRDWPSMLQARREMFAGISQYPAQALVVVASLMHGALVEVDAIAVVPE